jgi:hypothetical protein
MGTYDQLEELNNQPTVKHAPVGSPDTLRTVETTENRETPYKAKNRPKNRPTESQADQVSTREVTENDTQERDNPRDTSSENPREKTRGLPNRTEIQEFSFRLRDDVKVKVQAEVPNGWQDELEDVARKLDVKKLELYRFIFGEFLGKVKRKKDT